MRFVQKCVQDMSNSTRANTRTLPECASINDKKLQNIFKFVFKSDTSIISGRVFHNLQELSTKEK